LIAWLKRLSASLFGWITARALYYRSQRVSDAPERPEHNVVYIVGEDGYDWSAVMKCPGGCGKVLEMNLLPDAKPVWRVTEHEDGSVSLHPSVWLKTGCRCHFVLQRGGVRWTKFRNTGVALHNLTAKPGIAPETNVI
jgi:hypothetical protein